MIPIISLAALIAALAIGIIKKINCGLVAVLFAFLIGPFIVGMPDKSIYISGWPTQVFFLSISVMLLFGVANNNGTMQKMTQGLVLLARGNDKLLPIFFFLGSALLCGIGAGVPFCGVLLPICFSVAEERKIDPLLMCLCTTTGIMAGGLSPLAIHGIAAKALAAPTGVTNYTPIWYCVVFTMTLYAVIAYVWRKGYKIPNAERRHERKIEKLDGKQWLTLIVILIVVGGVLVFGLDIGLIAFAGGALLITCGVADEKEVIKGLPWSIMLMIGGMSILINVVNKGGGISYLSHLLSAGMTVGTAQGIMCIMGGLMSAVSSAIGVVMPTLIPTTPQIAAELSVSTISLISGIVIGSNIVVISPLSTAGAIAMASLTESVDKAKFFNYLLISAVLFVAGAAVLSFLGVYELFF